MSDWTPRPGSKVEMAIELIRKNGSARTLDIADHIDSDRGSIGVILAPALDAGLLTACDIQVPGSPPLKEYRLGGGVPAKTFKDITAKIIAKRKPAQEPAPASEREERGKQLAKELQVTTVIPARRARAMAKTPPVVDTAAAGEKPKRKYTRKAKAKSAPPPRNPKGRRASRPSLCRLARRSVCSATEASTFQATACPRDVAQRLYSLMRATGNYED